VSNHDYTPEQALDTLLTKLREKDLSLEAAVRSAIDLGKDVTEVQRLGRKRVRRYRKTVPFTHEEALHISLEVLHAYFVDLPLCINSAVENFKSAAVTVSRQNRPASWVQEERRLLATEHVGDEKPLEIELQTMTQISRTQQQTLPLKTWEQQLIDQQLNNLKTTIALFDFTEES
jgi:hypothetical protein